VLSFVSDFLDILCSMQEDRPLTDRDGAGQPRAQSTQRTMNGSTVRPERYYT